MSKQASKTIMMVRPKHFGYDPESAESNAFQNEVGAEESTSIQQAALKEFDQAVAILRNAGVSVVVIEDTDKPIKPNAIFPNNWISFHGNRAILYPMMATNRRNERREDILKQLTTDDFEIEEVIDLSVFEQDNKYLESTGSFILDYRNKLVYACRSERTHPEVLEKFCEIEGYEPVLFDAFDKTSHPIYHTNVMMCLADQYAVICLGSIPTEERADVQSALQQTGHLVVEITLDQMYAFAGNMFEVEDASGRSILVMSDAAMKSLSLDQKEQLSSFSTLLAIPIPTIEKYGGGSIRCMMCRVN